MNNKKMLPVATILFCAIIFSACIPAKETPTQQTPESTETMIQESESMTDPESSSETTEQTVSVTANYTSPAGEEEVIFNISVDENGVITKAETEGLATNPTSIIRQKSFAESLPTAIVGKNISELSNIDRVGGSSLTTNAFNASLEQLRAQL